MHERNIRVEVVYATPERQLLTEVELARNATVADAIAAAFGSNLPTATLDSLQAGIWGRPVERSRKLDGGERVELYRPLQRDPREARRALAAAGKAMSDADQTD